MNNDLKCYEIISSIQDRLINIEIALKNKTMSTDIARKHIEQIIILTERIEKLFNIDTLTVGIKDVANDLLEKTKIQYSPYDYACK